MERFLNLLSGMSSLWDRSRDPLMNEVRSYQRGMLVGFIGFVFFGALSLLVLPEANQATPMRSVVGIVQNYANFFLQVLGLICMLIAAYNLYRYFRFNKE